MLLLTSTLLLAEPIGAAPSPERALVLVAEGADAAAVAADARATLLSLDADTGAAVVESAHGGLLQRLARDARVLDAEPDGRVRGNTASWDTVSWDTASWDTASWDTASWDTASWDTASWDTASWDTASWDTASWDTASWDGTGSPGERLAPPWGLLAIRAPEAWAHGVPVHNRLVCVVDSGIEDDHPALAGAVWRDASGHAGRNFVAPGLEPEDDAGHGTHVASIVAGAPTASWPFSGVARPLVASAKVLDASGIGRTSDVIAAIGWCGDIGANVVLLALSEDAPTKALRQAVEGARQAGMLVVASGGNQGACARCGSPIAAYAGVLGVGALAPDGSIAPFSAQRPHVDLYAPGVWITSAIPTGYATHSGTSQAAAFAAGAAALVWAHGPATLDADDVARALRGTDRGAVPTLDVGAAVASLGVGP